MFSFLLLWLKMLDTHFVTLEIGLFYLHLCLYPGRSKTTQLPDRRVNSKRALIYFPWTQKFSHFVRELFYDASNKPEDKNRRLFIHENKRKWKNQESF